MAVMGTSSLSPSRSPWPLPLDTNRDGPACCRGTGQLDRGERPDVRTAQRRPQHARCGRLCANTARAARAAADAVLRAASTAASGSTFRAVELMAVEPPQGEPWITVPKLELLEEPTGLQALKDEVVRRCGVLNLAGRAEERRLPDRLHQRVHLGRRLRPH